MVTKKIFELSWRCKYCDEPIVCRFTDVYQFAGAFRAVLENSSDTLLDVSTRELSIP